MIKRFLLFVLLLSPVAVGDALLALTASTLPDGTTSDQDQTIESKVRDERALHASRDTTAAAGEERALMMLPVVEENFKSGLEKSWIARIAKKLTVWRKVESVPSKEKAAQMKKNEEYWERTATARAKMVEGATRRVEAAKTEEEKEDQIKMKALWEKSWDHKQWVMDTWRARHGDLDDTKVAERNDLEADLREAEKYLEKAQDTRTKGQAAWSKKKAAGRIRHPKSETKSVLKKFLEFRRKMEIRAWEKKDAALEKEVDVWKKDVKASKYALAKAEIALYLPDFEAAEKENFGLIEYQDLLRLDPKIIKDLEGRVTHENLFAFEPDYRRYLYFTGYHGAPGRLLIWLEELFTPKKTRADVVDTAVGQPSG